MINTESTVQLALYKIIQYGSETNQKYGKLSFKFFHRHNIFSLLSRKGSKFMRANINLMIIKSQLLGLLRNNTSREIQMYK